MRHWSGLKLNQAIISKELAKRGKGRKDYVSQFKLEQFLFPEQLAFVNDPEPFKVAMCSRRAGKTVSMAAWLIHTAISFDGVDCLYITLQRNTAKKIIWKELKKFCATYELAPHINETELTLTMKNGSTIYLSGAKDSSEIENFRGMAFKLVVVDECQSFRSHIEDMVDDVLSAALMDYAGSLALIGTPPAIPAGYFHDIYSNPNNAFSKHAWTFFQNPHVALKSGKTHQQLLERELRRRGVASDDPSIQREYFGRCVLDSDSLLLHYTSEVNSYEFLPTNLNRYILGIDLGFNDSDALAVVGYNESSRTSWLVEEQITAKQDITALVEQVRAMTVKYQIHKMVIDAGGLGLKIAEEIRRRHAIPVVNAEKARKMENVAFLNDALRTGAFKAKADSRFAQECMLVEIDREKSTPDKIVVSKAFHSDIIDAVLYAFKLSPAYAYEAPQLKPVSGTPEWYLKEVAEMEEAALEHFTELERIESKKQQNPYE